PRIGERALAPQPRRQVVHAQRQVPQDPERRVRARQRPVHHPLIGNVRQQQAHPPRRERRRRKNRRAIHASPPPLSMSVSATDLPPGVTAAIPQERRPSHPRPSNDEPRTQCTGSPRPPSRPLDLADRYL